MFYGNDPDGKGYSTRAHLAEVVGTLGPPPLDLLQRGKRSQEFFTEDGTYDILFLDSICFRFKRGLLTILRPGRWKADVEVPQGTSLEQSEEFLEGKNKEMFLNFMRGMLQWRPEDRKTARQLLKDPWLNDQVTVPGCSTTLAREGRGLESHLEAPGLIS